MRRSAGDGQRSEDRAAFENLWLGYTQTYGAPELRETIAAQPTRRGGRLRRSCVSPAPARGIFAANCGASSTVTAMPSWSRPNYQSHETLADGHLQ